MSNRNSVALANYISTKVLKFDWIFILLTIFFIVAYYINIAILEYIKTVVLSAIAITYYISSFAAMGNSVFTTYDLFINKLLAISSAIFIVAVLFIIQQWSQSDSLLIASLGGIAISLAYIIFLRIKKPEMKVFSNLTALRLIVFILIGIQVKYSLF